MKRKWTLTILAAGIILGYLAGNADRPPTHATTSQEEEEIPLPAPATDKTAAASNSEGTGTYKNPERVMGAASLQQATTFTLRLAGTSFVPRDSDQMHDYAGAGCIQGKSLGNGLWAHSLSFPNNAVIRSFTLFFYDDNDTASVQGYVTRYDQQGGFEDIALVNSTDSGGYNDLTVTVNHIVDGLNYAYVAFVVPGGNGPTTRACGVEIQYDIDVSQLSLPAILNMANGR